MQKHTVHTMIGSNDNYVKISIEETSKPFTQKGSEFINRKLIKDNYWIVIDGHILLFDGKYPKCHPVKEVLQKISQILFPGSEVIQLHKVYIDENGV